MGLFLRLFEHEVQEQPDLLRRLVLRSRQGEESPLQHSVVKADLNEIPGSPFAYWLTKTTRRIFRDFDRLEADGRTVALGLYTSDDFRFLRGWWEVSPASVVWSKEQTLAFGKWVGIAKGGGYRPFYADIELVLNYARDGVELKRWSEMLPGTSHWSRSLRNEPYYFCHGITWSKRTQGLAFRALPSGSAFADKGPCLFVEHQTPFSLLSLLGILNSEAFGHLVRAQVARVELAQSFEVGIIASTPVPSVLPEVLGECVCRLIVHLRLQDTGDEVSHLFAVPRMVMHGASDLATSASSAAAVQRQRADEVSRLRTRLDEIVDRLYGLTDVSSAPQIQVSAGGSQDGAPGAEVASDEEDLAEAQQFSATVDVADLLSWCVGGTFGRWDVRMARNALLIPELQGPFDRLPSVAPGGLVGPDGLPASAEAIASEAWLRARPNVISLPPEGCFAGPASITAAGYPIPVAWDGILVDDEGHPKDIVAALRRVLTYVYGDRAPAIEDEALTLLRGDGAHPKSLRDWFRNTKASALGKTFFDFHIQRYSKSRRKAPIYWRLAASANAPCAVWLYYPRLTHDTLWRVLGDYVTPRRELAERQLAELRPRREAATGAERRKLDREIDQTATLLDSVSQLEQELRRVAERGYAPDLDDGVAISAAPLHRVIPWSEPARVWRDLEAGEYDWAKLAMALWPERVREKCQTDRSLAIAHGLE